jgi:hypothetical protein
MINLFWLIRYFGIAFQCVTPVLEALWVTSDRVQHELDLLLIPIDIQLREWEYPKNFLPDTPDATDELRHGWGRNPRIGSSIYCKQSPTECAFLLPGLSDFVVIIGHPHNAYLRCSNMNNTEHVQVLSHRNAWIELFLYMTSQTPQGPETVSHQSMKVGPWDRDTQGAWYCVP